MRTPINRAVVEKSNNRNVALPVTLLLFDSFISFQDSHTFQQKLKS